MKTRASPEKMQSVHWTDVANRYLKGETLKELGDAYGISGETVRQHLLSLGVQLRSKSYHLSTEKNPTRGKGHRPDTIDKLRGMAVCQFSNPAARLRASELQILAMANGKIAKVSVLEDRVAAVLVPGW